MDPKWLKDQLERPGRSQSALARRLGIAASAVNRMCNGRRQIKAWEAERIHEYLAEQDHTVAATRRNLLPEVSASLLPVRGIVEAGSWREVAYQEFMEPEYISAPTALMESGVFAQKVQGPSMDLHYPDGSYLIVQPWYGGPLPSGKHVVIERSRDGLVETTLKEVVQTPGGTYQLWPKSTHPAHQTPIALDPNDESLRVVGVVTWAFSKVG